MQSIQGHIFKCLAPGTFAMAILACFLSPANAKDVTLGWDSNGAVSGYKLYYKPGESGGRNLKSYNGKDALEGESPIDVGRAKEFTLHGLADSKKYDFVVTAYNDEGKESSGSREVQVLGPGDIPNPYKKDYNRGWRITAGDLQGFTVYYHDSAGVVPTLGPTEAVPNLRQRIAGVRGVGIPLNLEPSGTHFFPPVILHIPCSGYYDVSGLDLYYFDDTREQWFLAHDAEDGPGVVQPDAVGWLVPGSRVNNNTGNPSTIEIQVYHFSGVQAAVDADSEVVSSSAGGGVEGGGGSCFISTMSGNEE
jgi:hypothetical protein